MIKIANINISEDNCGPYVIKLLGNDAQYFKVVGKELYFLLDQPCKNSYTVTISIEDLANRFAPVQTNYTLSSPGCVCVSTTTTTSTTTTIIPNTTTSTTTTTTAAPSSQGLNLYGWGANDDGRAGYGGQTYVSYMPIPVYIPPLLWKTISTKSNHTLGISSSNGLYGWGDNLYGQIYQQINSPVRTSYRIPNPILGGSQWSKVAAGSRHSLAINSVGELYAWGSNSNGQLGDGTVISKGVPTRIGSESNWIEVSAGEKSSYAINSNYELYAWGSNDFGQLGDGSYTSRLLPVKINLNCKQISAGYWHVLALDTFGQLYGWGRNSDGQIGDGTIITKPTPTAIISTLWSKISAGHTHSLGLDVFGYLYAWGNNNYYQLGDGTITPKFTPTKITFMIGNSEVPIKDISAGFSHSLAVDVLNNIYMCGQRELSSTVSILSTFTRMFSDNTPISNRIQFSRVFAGYGCSMGLSPEIKIIWRPQA